MVHPHSIYVVVEVGGEKLVIAKERLVPVLGEKSYKILEERKGQDLEGVSYVPPLLEETHQKTGGTLHRVFLSSEYVTMTDGTGLVHMAPGHGEEDFEVGQRNGLPVLSPVDASGRFTPEAGKYAGLQVREANPVIVKDLEARGLLFREETIEHSYPHCWRCKTPLILRATDQWFIKVTGFKDKMLRENKSVRWTPEWAGSKRFYAWLVGARDWFYNQLVSSILVFNKTPYKSVLMHGHTLDPDGEKMSKSKGNFVSPGDVIGKYGRDALRFYTLQTTVWEDFQFSWDAVEAVARDLQIIWNVYAFATLYMSLDKFAPLKWPLQRLSRLYRHEDRWLLSRTERLVQDVSEHNEEMEFHHSARALRDFVIEDLSHWYIRLVRRRFWMEKKSRDKISAYAVLHHALRTWLSLAAPMMPFVT